MLQCVHYLKTLATPADVLAQCLAALNTAIPGSPTADSVNERLKTLDDNYTATRAAYLDNINNVNLLTLGANITLANINSEVDTVLNTAIPGTPTADSIYERIATMDDCYTCTRAAYLDNINNADLVNITLTNINAEVDTVLNTAIPGSPTADSIYERIATMDDNYTATRASYLDNINNADLPNITLVNINAEVDTALNTTIPGSPTADSINERIATLDDNYTATRAGYLDNINNSNLTSVGANLTLANINAEVDTALNTAIPGSPTADSVNERIKTLDDNYTVTRAGHLDHLLATDTAGTHDVTTANDTTETDVFSISTSTIYGLSIYLDLNALESCAEGGTVTVKLYNKIDESNYREIAKSEYVVGCDNVNPNFEAIMINHNSKVTIQCSTDVTATRTINYRYIKRPFE